MKRDINREAFFTLLQAGLWSESDKRVSFDEPVNWEEVYRLASEQSVVGLVLAGIDCLPSNQRPPKIMLLQWIGEVQIMEQQSVQINNGLKRLVNLFDEHRVEYVVVKGQTVAAHYPQPLHRQSGDIDYYCNSENFPKSQEVIKHKWGITPEVGTSEHHVGFDYMDVSYEGHFALILLYGRKRESYWEMILDEDSGNIVDIEGVKVKTLSPTLHILYVFIHLYSHLLGLGVGLRQFCDLAVMLHYCRDNVDLPLLMKHLHALGMEKAFYACGTILVDYLGLPQEELGYEPTSKDRKYATRILRVVFYRGNMGHYNKKNGFSGWKHYVESTAIKVSHFVKFMPLTPGYSCGWLTHELDRKVQLKFKELL